MTLAPVFFGAFRRRKLATALALAAIALGVALGVAVFAIHEAALAELDTAARTLSGEADWQVKGPAQGFSDTVWETLARHPEVEWAAPVIEFEARIMTPDGVEQLPLLAIDVLAQAQLAPHLLPRPQGDRLEVFAEDAIFLSHAARERFGGQTLRLLAGGDAIPFRVAGDLPGIDEERLLAVIDIAAAQKRFALPGRLTRIDLKLAEHADVAAIRALLPPDLTLEEPTTTAAQTARATRAYRANLGMLASIALMSGLFLVFSTQALSFARRQAEFAFLRALGLDDRRLLAWLLAEGGLIGAAGGVLGIALGQGLVVFLLTRFGGDLGAGFFSGLAPKPHFSWAGAGVYLSLAITAGLIGAWLPARAVLATPPAIALKAVTLEPARTAHGHPRLSLAAWVAAFLVAQLPPWQELPIGGYLAVALLLAGALFALPCVAAGFSRLAQKGDAFLPTRLAAARLAAAPGQATLAIAGVMSAVALAGAMAIMVHSFRVSLERWLTQVLPAELHLVARAGRTPGGLLPPSLQQAITAVPGIARVEFTRHEKLPLLPGRAPVALLARPTTHVPVVGATAAVAEPAIWISEALADATGWRPGKTVELPLAGGMQRFAVKGLWRDYARQTGAILLDLEVFRRLTGDFAVHEAAIHLTPDADLEAVRHALLALAAPGTLEVATSGEIRRMSLALFDRTFLITYGLEAAAIGIGLSGVAASFAALAAARRREFGMLRHLGVTRGEIAQMLASEGGLSALAGVMTGLAAAFAIALVLIEVINRQSFHWSMDWAIPWAALAIFSAAMVGLAALAAVLAGRLAMQQVAVFAVREDW